MDHNKPCAAQLWNAGEPAPRTCGRCGLGPCPLGVVRENKPVRPAPAPDEPEVKAMGRPDACDLCGDQPETLHVHARCHLTAPLRASISDGVLTLRCYVPECNRMVARFRLAEGG